MSQIFQMSALSPNVCLRVEMAKIMHSEFSWDILGILEGMGYYPVFCHLILIRRVWIFFFFVNIL